MISFFNHGFAVKMTKKTAFLCSHVGDCAKEVTAAIALKLVSRPKDATPEAIKKELAEYGAWEESELQDDKTNWERIVWLAAGNIKDECK